ncbi:MAG: hypothetical protein ACLSDZ_03420 [Bifidobacterium sp.]
MMRHNWFPNPMLGDPKPTRSLDCSVNQWGSPDNPGIILRHSSDLIGGYAEWVVSGLPAGVKCAFIASCGFADATDTFRGALLSVKDSSDNVLADSKTWANNERLRVGLTVPSDGVVKLIFRGRTGKDTAFYQIICTEAGSDESFFTGGTMPLQNN